MSKCHDEEKGRPQCSRGAYEDQPTAWCMPCKQDAGRAIAMGTTGTFLEAAVVEVGGSDPHHVTAPCDICDQPRPLRPAVFGMDPVQCCDACYKAHNCEPRALYIASEPKPPTLREWLGDRVSELGPWADVLREQPIPASWITKWTWLSDHGVWTVESKAGKEFTINQDAAIRGTIPGGPANEALQMALFASHPAVKPEPRKSPLRTWFGNEEEP